MKQVYFKQLETVGFWMTLTLIDMRLTRQVQKCVYTIWINVNHSRCNYMQLLTGTWFMILSSLVPSHFSCKTVSMKNPMCSYVFLCYYPCGILRYCRFEMIEDDPKSCSQNTPLQQCVETAPSSLGPCKPDTFFTWQFLRVEPTSTVQHRRRKCNLTCGFLTARFLATSF